MRIDGNGNPYFTLDSFNVEKCSPSAFIGETGNARGDHDGTSDPTTLFNVTGDVIVRVFGVCTVTLVGAATIEVGVAGNTASLIAQVSDASTIAAGDVWIDNSVAEVKVAALANVPASSVVTNSSNIIETIASANITAGNIYYICLWRPLTLNSSVVSAI